MPIFTEPDGPHYIREISTYDRVTSSPMLEDPYERRTVEVRSSRVVGAGEGLFALRRLEPNTVIAFYNGQRVAPKRAEDHDQLVSMSKFIRAFLS